MATFKISDALARLIGGWGLVLNEVLAAAEAIRQKFPDLDVRVTEFEAWLVARLAPVLDVEHFKSTIRGIALDVMSGLSGVDSDAWTGSV